MWLLLSFFLSSLFPSLSPFFRPVQVAEMMLDNMANVTPVMDLLITLQVAKDARQGAVPPAGTKRSRRHFVTLRTLMGGGATTLPYRGFAVPPSVPLLGSVSSYSLTYADVRNSDMTSQASPCIPTRPSSATLWYGRT